ncbi:hypothetical protein NL676_021966 [Syzygium grande]|nr:hypothetical protein NL676_021966 [Syzygium grande]
MDGDNSLNMRNWGYYEPTATMRGLGLNLMPSVPEKPLFDSRNAAVMAASNGGAYHHRDLGASQAMYPMDYVRDAWGINPRDKFYNAISGNHNYSMIPETSTAHHMQMVQPPDLLKEERATQVEQVGIGNEIMENGPSKKRPGPKGPKSPKPKKAKRGPRVPKAETTPSVPRSTNHQENYRINDKWDQHGYFMYPYSSLLMYRDTSAVLPLGLWWVAICLLHYWLVDISLAHEHQKARSKDSRQEDEYRSI